jgi:two-component system sensor histidine kinase DesK
MYVAMPFLLVTSPLQWTVYGFGLALFLVLYFRGFWLQGWRLAPIIVCITAIGAILIPWNPGASVFFVYAAGFVGDTGRAGVALRWLGAILLVLVVETLVLSLPMVAWIPGVVIALMVGGGNIHFADKRRADQLLRIAHDEVEHLAKVAERERIARDLHDLLGHTLSLIVLKSELAAKLAERDTARAIEEIRDVERISREALHEVRRAVLGYRQLTLSESLAGARQALNAADIELDARIAPVRMDGQVEGVVSIVLREAITNVIRHSRAGRCEVCLSERGGRVCLQVQDNGVGGQGELGSGLTGMRVRVEELGGRFEYDGTAGARVRIELPHAAPTAQEARLVPREAET